MLSHLCQGLFQRQPRRAWEQHLRMLGAAPEAAHLGGGPLQGGGGGEIGKATGCEGVQAELSLAGLVWELETLMPSQTA